jgi:hypothetical protein
MKQKSLFSCLLTLLLIEANSQGGFKSRILLPAMNTNVTKLILETGLGYYIGAGISVETVNGVPINKLCVMGIDNQGHLMWTKKYGNKKMEYLNTNSSRSFLKSGNNFYYVTCVRDSNNKQIGALIKLNLLGDTLWQRYYRDSIEDVIPQAMSASVDGGFLLTGLFQNWNNSTSPCLIIKTDSFGQEIWRQRVHKVVPDVSCGYAIVQDSASKKIVIAGYQYIGNASSWSTFDSFIIADSLGNKLFQKSYMPYGGIYTDVIQSNDKGIVAVGSINYQGSLGWYNYKGAYAMKLDLSNPNIPTWKLNGYGQLSLSCSFSRVIQKPNKDFFLSGNIDTLLGQQLPNFLHRYTLLSNNGQVKWDRLYNYKFNAFSSHNKQSIVDVELLSDGGWISAISEENLPEPNPYFFIRYDSTGCDSTSQYCLNPVSVEDAFKLIPNSDISIFPNPASDRIEINTSQEYPQNFTNVLFYNSFGQLVCEEQVMLNNSKATLKISKLENGLYFMVFKGSGVRTYIKQIVVSR